MKIRYKCEDSRSADGLSETVAATPSLALVYWHFRHLPESVHQTPGPYSKQFLTLVIAACERKWGTAPDIAIPQPPGKYDWKEAVQRLEANDPEVLHYEQVCLEILHWLENYDVSDLTVDGMKLEEYERRSI